MSTSMNRLLATAVALTVMLTAQGQAHAYSSSPSPYVLPTPDRYNTTPDCPVSPQAPVCLWSAEPPYDSANPEGAAPYYRPSNYYTNCAYWAAEKRPDIEQYAMQVYGYHPASAGAADWKPDAVKAGYPVDHTPHAGDIAVWVPQYGHHVAYVENVLPDGSIIVSEMDLVTASGAHGATEWLPASAASVLYFIHLKPVGRQMHPRVAGVTRQRHAVTITITIAPDSGSVAATATSSRSRRRLGVWRHRSSELIISGQLPSGHWTITVFYKPARGYSKPPNARIRVTIPGHGQPP